MRLLQLNYSPDTLSNPGEGLSFETGSSGTFPPAGSGGGPASSAADDSGPGPDHREIGAAYIRVSTPGQEYGTSLEKQREAVLETASRCGVFIPPEYLIEETWSGADFGRLGMQRLSSLVERCLVKHIFLFDTDRLARDPLHLLQFLRLCKENGVLVHFADGTVVETVLDEVVQFLKGFVGFQERELISKRTQDGKRKAAEKGRYPHGVGRGIYGYDYDPTQKIRSINEGEATIVREIFDRALGGVSCNVIAKDLQDRGITTKSGAKFDARKVYHILRNEAYTGAHWWGRYRFQKLHTNRDGRKRLVTPQPRESWIRMTTFTPQIMSPAKWGAVQEALDNRRRPGRLWDYQFSRLFKCAECGSNIVGATQRDRGKKYPYYRCSGTVPKDGQPRICSLESYRADQLEPAVWEHIYSAINDPSPVFDQIRANVSGPTDVVGRQVTELQRSIRKARQEEETLVLQRTKGIIDQETLERLITPITNYRVKLEQELALVQEQRNLSDNVDRVEELVSFGLAAYRKGLSGLDAEARNRLLRLLRIRLTGRGRRVLVTGVIDPSLFTTGQTLESTSNWRYIVVLKPKPDEWPPSRKKSRS